MKATELMIGDWVSDDGTPMKVTELKFKGVSEERLISLQGDSCSFRNIILDDRIQPIPLTPEILEDSGFTHDEFEEQATRKWKCKDERPCVMYSEDRRICIDNRKYDLNSNNDWGIHIDSVDMSTIGYMEITFVHQLQHAFRLFGIDREIII